MNTVQNGKGSTPRKAAKKKFDSNYDTINWKKDNKKPDRVIVTENGICKRYYYGPEQK